MKNSLLVTALTCLLAFYSPAAHPQNQGQILPAETAPEALPVQEGPMESLPAEIHGIWANPTCDNPGMMTVLSGFYKLTYEYGKYNIDSLKVWRTERRGNAQLYNFRSSYRSSYIMKTEPGQPVKMLALIIHPLQKLSSAWGSTHDVLATSFEKCDKAPNQAGNLSAPEIYTPFILDKLFQACGDIMPDRFPHATTCHDGIFTVADADSSGLLTSEEMETAFRIAGFLSTYNAVSCGQTPKFWPGNIIDDSKNFAAEMLVVADTDKDGALSPKETMDSFSNPLAGTTLAQFLANIRLARQLVPFVPLSLEEKACFQSAISATERDPKTGASLANNAYAYSVKENASTIAAGGCGCGAATTPAQKN